MSGTNDARDLIYRFWGALDRRAYDDVIAYITDDCFWMREAPAVGKDVIRQQLDARPSGLLVRHVVTNIIVDEIEGGYTATYLLMAYGHLGAFTGPAPDCGPPGMVADIATHLTFADDALKIARIDTALVFARPRT